MSTSTVRQRNAPNVHPFLESIEDSLIGVEKKIEKSLVVAWEDLAHWQRDNDFITSGYRRASGSFKKSLASLGYLHNESVNIWTHLLGAIVFASLGIWLKSLVGSRYETATTSDILAFSCFFSGAAVCLGMSATFHTISNHSHTVMNLGNKLDYIGIVFLIWGSFVPSIYYGFHCEPNWQHVYWGMISALGVGCATVSIVPRFRTAEYRPTRALLFVSMGLSAIFPVLHGIGSFGIQEMQYRIGLFWLLLQGFLYITGAGLYVARVPERLKPGSFDIWGSSHQIFHILVLLAAAAHLKGLVIAFDYWHRLKGRSCY